MFYDINNYIFPGAFNQKSRNRKEVTDLRLPGLAWWQQQIHLHASKALIQLLLHFGGLVIRTGW